MATGPNSRAHNGRAPSAGLLEETCHSMYFGLPDPWPEVLLPGRLGLLTRGGAPARAVDEEEPAHATAEPGVGHHRTHPQHLDTIATHGPNAMQSTHEQGCARALADQVGT